MAATKVTTKVIADDAVTIDKINDSALVTESEGISSNDNDTTIPTSAAVKDYVDTEVAGLVDSAPATLDTLNELAAALGDDASFSTTVTNSIATKQDASTALTTTTNFSGDVSGTYNAIVIADDSHNHTIANVDGLQTALDAKLDGTGTAGTLPKLSDSNTITDSAISESGEIIDIDTTGAIRVPDGTTAERPGTPVAGMFRYNTTDGQFEGYTTEWGAIAGSGGGGAAGTLDIEQDTFDGDGSTVAFTLNSSCDSENNLQVYIDGVYQSKDNFSVTGTTVTFSTAPPNGSAIEVVHIVPSSSGGGGISWVTDDKTVNFTATAGEGYFVNNTSAAITVTLPSSPSAGDEVSIVDYAGTADTNNITVTSSDNINGAADDLAINYNRGVVSMVYVDATQGWIAYNAANETATALGSPLPSSFSVDYLVVAGGGAGGYGYGGGGGAGGLRTSYGSTSGGGASAESSLSLTTSTNYTVSVGAGGTGGNRSAGSEGSDSTFSTITSDGGGEGKSSYTPNVINGGSGGGGTTNIAGGTGTSGQGYDGGGAGLGGPSDYRGTGGGGAAQAGQTYGGGNGLAVSITGSSVTYAGGGGGAYYAGTSGASGGSGGGGNGTGWNSGAQPEVPNGTDGTDNLGGGGGGAMDGGSGVVILRYPNTFTVTETTSTTVLTFSTTTDGSDKVTTFTAGENGTIQFS